MCIKANEERSELPCESGVCKITKGDIFELLPANKTAWGTYLEIVTMSGYDFNGHPTISKIDFYMDFFEMGLNREEKEKLVDKIIYIHSYYRSLLIETKASK